MAQTPPSANMRQAEIDELLIKGCYGSAIAPLAMEKTPFGEAMTQRREKIFASWQNLQKRLSKQLIPSEQLKEMLRTANAPTEFAQIGLTFEQYIHGIKTAQLIRKRYTILDMLYETGLLDAAIATLC